MDQGSIHGFKIPWNTYYLSVNGQIHPGKLTWTDPKSPRKIIFLTSNLGFHVKFHGCIPSSWSKNLPIPNHGTWKMEHPSKLCFLWNASVPNFPFPKMGKASQTQAPNIFTKWRHWNLRPRESQIVREQIYRSKFKKISLHNEICITKRHNMNMWMHINTCMKLRLYLKSYNLQIWVWLITCTRCPYLPQNKCNDIESLSP